MNQWLRGVLVLLLALLEVLAAPVSAHEMSMAEISLREISRGEFIWQWTATNDRQGTTVDLKPAWPAHCQAEDHAVHCGEAGLQGTLTMEGVGQRYSAALVKIEWFNGPTRVYTLTAGQPTLRLYGAADDGRGWADIASVYAVLGVEHILSGIDHLLFVISLLFLVGFNQRLLWTISAFTLAHSLTLASAALGWLTLRAAPVEACIALSIVLVAAEALHSRNTLARRWPALVAFLFGLVHGLGFASALQDIGLPQAHLPVALLTFNLGVEAGQLLTVALAWVVWRLASRWPAAVRLRTACLYGIGSIAAWWSWLRVAAIFGLTT